MQNYGLTYSIIILILLIIICNISKYVYNGEEFQNNNNLLPIQTMPIMPIYCPLEHPHIPCNLVKICNCKTT